MKNREPGNGRWDTKCNEDDIKLFIKLGGSEVNAENAIILCEMYLEKEFHLHKIIRAVHN
jgi:hypothetical protein